MSSRILVVEDSPTQAEALRSLLVEHGYEVVVARSAEAALERVADAEFDLVLSDVVMSGLTGYDLTVQLKQDPRWRSLPVVLLTSLSDPMNIVRGLECGADNYVTKPYDPDHLLARIRNVLDNRRLRQNVRTKMGVSVHFLGRDLNITSEREQILDLFISSVEDVVRTNTILQQRERELADAHAQLTAYARQKSREARVSTERYRVLMQNAGDALVVLDVDGGILEVNARAEHLFGRSAEELLNQSLDHLMVQDGQEGLQAWIPRLRTNRQVTLGERRFVDGDGNEVWCELIASLTPVEGDDLVLLIARDVTERRKAVTALYETNQQLSTLIEASPVAIVAVDREGTVQLWNSAAQRTFGWTADEVMHRSLSALVGDQEEEVRGLLDRVLDGEPINGLECMRTRKDGSAIAVSVSASPWRDSAGEAIGSMVVIADITERWRAREALREREEAERANRAKSEFLSRMSHELRTPLNAILGFAQLLEMEELSEDQRESVDQILRGGRHLLGLINEVLDIVRVESGRLPLSVEPIQISHVIAEALELIRPVAAERGINLAASPDALSSPVLVQADHQRLGQVLLNLLSNAIKYNRPGGAVQVTLDATEDGLARIAVSDTGPGIAKEMLARVFVPFDRLGAEQSGIEGTGLGLPLSQAMVEAMGGTIGVESEPGEGSRFWITLPLTDVQPEARGPETPAAAEPASVEGGPGGTLLYIEDSPPNLTLVERILARRPGVKMIPAVQGGLGLDLAFRHHPDLILLDLNLPDLSGEEVLARLRSDPRTREVPVVVLSADATTDTIRRLREAGASDYLSKPFAVARLLELVDTIMPSNAKAEGAGRISGGLRRSWRSTTSSATYACSSACPARRGRVGPPPVRGGSEPPVSRRVAMRDGAPAKGRILIVDDEPVNVRLLRRLLGPHGYEEVHEVTDARLALSEVARLEPDLILLDLNMPFRSGLEILAELRESQPPGSYLPVLVLTADSTVDTKRRALEVGANDFLTKPFDTTEVLLRVKNLLETRSLHVHMDALVKERTRALEEAQVEILERLALAAEFRDDDTGQHTRRVGERSAVLARALGMPDAEVELIRRAAQLHDIGKIAVPDSILLKPDRLTAEEWVVMREHTTRGASILSGGHSNLIIMAEAIALCHHERWDGSGYPRGLRGTDIPLPARVVATVDFFDALTHDRRYREAWPRERVIAEIERGAGTHFDPEIVRIFLQLGLDRG